MAIDLRLLACVSVLLLGLVLPARIIDLFGAMPTDFDAVGSTPNDQERSFTSPDDHFVRVVVRMPRGDGTYSRSIHPQESADAYFPAMVREALAVGAHHLLIPKRRYVFQGPSLCDDKELPGCGMASACTATHYENCPAHWTIGAYPASPVLVPSGIADLDIDLQGSTLVFRAPVTGIQIIDVQRVRLKNFTIDWPALPVASLGGIAADPTRPGHNELVIDDGFPVRDPTTGRTVRIEAVDPWDGQDARGHFAADADNAHETYFVFGGAPQPDYLGRTVAGEQTFSCRSCRVSESDGGCVFFDGCANFDGFAVGARVVVRHYTYNGFAVLVSWSDDVSIEGATILTGPGMGFGIRSDGGHRGFRLADSRIQRAAGRVISTASDGINVTLEGDTLITDNDIGDQGDDGLNISPHIGSVSGVDGAVLTVQAACDPDPMDAPIAGDSLALFGQLGLPQSIRSVRSIDGQNCGSRRLHLDQPAFGIEKPDRFIDLTRYASTRFVVSGNSFHDNRGHGVVLGASYGLVDRNRFQRNSMGAISVGNDTGVTPIGLALSNNSTMAAARAQASDRR